MRVGTAGQLGIGFLLGFCLYTGSVQAGGPLAFNEAGGEPFFWLDNRAVYVVEQGDLSSAITNQDAAAAVRRAFKRWTDVPTADLQVVNLEDLPNGLSDRERELFKKDIAADDFALTQCSIAEIGTISLQRLLCDMFTACVDHINQVIQGDRAPDELNCPSPIIFDQDGSITARAFPTGVGVLGFSTPVSFSAPESSTQQFSMRRGGPVPAGLAPFGTGLFFRSRLTDTIRIESFRILQSFTVINGAFFGKDSPFDGDLLEYLEALLVHESGHFLGLGHTNGPNGDSAALNPPPGQVSAQPLPPLSPRAATLGPVDALFSAIRFLYVESMYPFFLSKESGTPEKDDQVALSTLYPCSAAAIASGKCQEDFFSQGSIAGNVFIPDTDSGQMTRAQGVLVTTRRIDDSSPDTALKEAVSQLSGSTFAPQRCWGPVFLDNNGNGIVDPGEPQVLSGCFGPCTVRDDPATPDVNEGRVACTQQIKNLDARFLFNGRCGWLNSTLSESRPTGVTAESHFELTGLAPGKYIVQAAPVLLGGFPSPVRTSFFTATPTIHSDTNRDFTLFANPQTGEFYNGLPTGCDTDTAGCGNETGNTADNPFAYTLIEVPASGRVNNVNIVLNTPTVRDTVFSDPGFDFCRLGDVDGNGSVDQGDIVAVGQAKAAFDQDPRSLAENRRADLNEDGGITFLDLDIIVDIVSLPDPFHGVISQEIKRGLAPFEAICAAAARDGCRIQAPVKTLQSDGTPSDEICLTAKEIGCQVIGCQ
jgi:hypothetical protein